MSKSLGNYIGITEPPETMFVKVMRISDDLMFRYYELLAGFGIQEIDTLRARIASGAQNPMEAKMELARRIVTDFHSAEEAARAAEEFTRVVRRQEVPSDIATVPLPEGVRHANGIRLDKMLARVGLADSVSDATRKIKAGAVEINGRRIHELVVAGEPGELLVQVGKNWRRIRV
jgi:tyrosyl-tRNA synthetase